MAQMPRYIRRNFAQEIGVVRMAGGDGLLTAGRALGSIADQISVNAQDRALREVASLPDSEFISEDPETGAVRVNLRDGSDRAALEFNKRATLLYTGRVKADFERTFAESAAAAGNDPAAFLANAKAAIGGFRDSAPEGFRDALTTDLQGMANRFYGSLLTRKSAADTAASRATLTARLGAVSNQLMAHADGGDTASPDFTRRQGEFETLLRDGVAAGFLTEELAQVDRDQVSSEIGARRMAFVAEGVLREKGAEAARDFIRSNVTEAADLSLSPAQRRQIEATVNRRISEYEHQQRVQRIEMQAAIKPKMDDEINGIALTGKGVGVTDAQVAAAGLDVEAWREERARAVSVYGASQALALATPEEAVATIARFEIDPARGNVRAQVSDWSALTKAWSARIDGVTKSPGDWVAKHAPGLAADVKAVMGGDLARLPAAIEQSRAMQTRLGVRADRQEALGKTAASALAGYVMGRDDDSPSARFDRLVQVHEAAGKHGDGLLGDLATGGLPQEAVLALRVARASGMEEGRRAFAALTVKPETVARIDPKLKREAEDKARSAYNASLGALRARQAELTGDYERFTSLQAAELGAATRYGLALAAASEDSAAGAQGHAKLFGRLRPIEDAGLAITVPSQLTRADLDAVKAGLESIKADAVGRLPAGGKYDRMVFAQSTWIDAGNGRYALFPPNRGVPLGLPDGGPLLVTLDQAVEAGRWAISYGDLQELEPERPRVVPPAQIPLSAAEQAMKDENTRRQRNEERQRRAIRRTEK